MNTATAPTRSEQKVCAQSLASLASLAILIHFVHEAIALFGDVPVVQPIVGVVAVAATVGLTLGWYRLSTLARRTGAAVLGSLWALAASEHLGNAVAGATAIDYTGLLTCAGGLILAFAAYYDYHRPLEV